MKFTKRDYDGARAKLAKAEMTPRQLDALEDLILRDAVVKAESAACTTNGNRTHFLSGTGSLLHYASDRGGYDAVRVAVYWFHEKHEHRQELSTPWNPIAELSTWRPDGADK